MTTFLHLTDIHIDLDYWEGAPTDCVLGSTGLGCCRRYDIPLSGSGKAGAWGNTNCDAPVQLVNATLGYIAKQHPNLEFALYGGDTVGHHDLSQSIGRNLATIDTLDKLLHTHLPHLDIFPNQGNHDTYPIDQTLPYVEPQMRKQISADWQNWIGEAAASEFADRGYYSFRISDRLRVASINSIQYDGHNVAKSSEIGPQEAWLRGILDSATPTDKVLILGHIPPMGGESTDVYNQWLVPLLANYSDVILGKLFGHSHKDALRVYFENTLNFTTALITPSLMPDKRDPCYRVYEYDPSSLVLQDYTQYCVNLTATNLENRLVPYRQYRFREVYPVPDLSDASLRTLAKLLPTQPSLALSYCNYNLGITQCNAEQVESQVGAIQVE